MMRSLESQKIPRLDSLGKIKVKSEPTLNGTKSSVAPRRFLNPNQHKNELKKLNHSILISYLELLDVLVKAPCSEIEGQQQTLREQKLNDLSVLFKNMHHLINELRPHQARDALICHMEKQKQERLEQIEQFRRHLERCVNVLETCISSIDTADNSIKRATITNEELTKMLAMVNSLGRMLNETNQKSKNNLNNIDNRKETNVNHRHNHNTHHHNHNHNNYENNIKINNNNHQNTKLNGFRNHQHNNNHNHHDELNEEKSKHIYREIDQDDIHHHHKHLHRYPKTNNNHEQQDDETLSIMNTFEFRNEVLCDFIDDYLI